MTCEGCGNPEAVRTRSTYEKNEAGQRVKFQWCDQCGQVGLTSLPDVFWDGKPEINLADDPQTGAPRVFSSKRDKARYMASRGIFEAGDSFHGAPFTSTQTKTVEKDSARKAIAIAKSYGKDRRRQEVLKILRQAELAQRQ